MTIDDDLRGDVDSVGRMRGATRGDLTIFHFALVSPMTAEFARLPRGRVLQYHNVTPAHFFAGYDAGIFRLATLGREELKTLVGHTDVALGDSEYNRQELEDARVHEHRRVSDRRRYRSASPARRGGRRSKKCSNERAGSTSCSSGRIVPNKKIEDHIKLAEHYKRYVDEQYRFVFVGKTDATPRYYNADPRAARALSDAAGPLHLHRARCPTRIWRRITGRPASTFRCRSTKASACRCSKRWPPTCRCSPTPRRRCPTRWAARACSSRRRISNMRRSSSASSPTTTSLRTQVIAGQRARLADFGDDRIRTGA